MVRQGSWGIPQGHNPIANVFVYDAMPAVLDDLRHDLEVASKCSGQFIDGKLFRKRSEILDIRKEYGDLLNFSSKNGIFL